MKTKSKKKSVVRSRPRSDREAERLERMYRELGFVFSGSPAPLRINERDRSLAPMDFRPRVDMTFSALSVP